MFSNCGRYGIIRATGMHSGQDRQARRGVCPSNKLTQSIKSLTSIQEEISSITNVAAVS